MNITAQDVNKLRQQTGAGMMDCKKALTEAEGDFEKAIEFLRKKGQKVSASRADRETREGAVMAKSLGNQGIIIALNCETDFVAKNADFLHLGDQILTTAVSHLPSDVEALVKLSVDAKPISDLLIDYIGKIGEKIEISHYQILKADTVITYIHPGARLGVLVGFKGGEGSDLAAIGKDVAMQIAAMNPVAVDKDGVDPALIQKEIEIGKEQARAEGKAEEMLEKIALGKLNKFYKESTLLNQEFVKDSSKTIQQYLKEQNPQLTISGFIRVQLGVN